MKAILIVRVSTDLQDFNAQIEDLKKEALERGYTEYHIISTKESGLADINNRDGLNELFNFIIENREYNTVFVTELSRLGRRQSILQIIKEWFVDNKIQLIIKDTGYALFKDNDRNEISVEGSIMFTLFALFAENEIKTKKDRFARKRKELMASGNSFFGGQILFGYELIKINDKNKLQIHEQNANIVRTIFNWYINGIDEINKNPSVLKITKECIKRGYHNYTHSKRNVNKLLKEEGYCGNKITNNKYKNMLFGKKNGEAEYKITQNEITYPKILDVDTYNVVQEKIKLKISDKKTKHITILSNLITCNSCGRKLSANYRHKTNSNSYRCTSRNETKECNEPIKSITMNLIDNVIWQVIKLDKKALINKIKEINPNIRLLEINNEISHINKKIETLTKESSNIQYILKNIKYTNINVTELLETNINRLNKIDKQITNYNEEILKLEINKLEAEKNHNKSDSVIYKNVDKIEQDLQKIKEYINHFVKEIIIKVNTKEYYIIQVELKYFSSNYYEYLQHNDDVLDKYLTLIVEKNQVEKIKIIKLNKRYNTNILKSVLREINSNPKLERLEINKINFKYE